MKKQVSKWVTWDEATRSVTADRLGISNEPDDLQLARMQNIATKIFDKVREWAGEAINVNSFFRSAGLNRAIGGSYTSQHCSGEAIDLDKKANASHTNADLFGYIADNLEFDQLIWEFGDDEEPDWVHVSLKHSGKNRRQILRSRRIKNKTIYEQIVR